MNLKIIEKHFPKMDKFYTVIQANQGNELPIFRLNGYEFTPINCNSDFTDMYACFANFDEWLSTPYKTHLPLEPSTLNKVDAVLTNLENNTTLIVGYMKTFEYMNYLHLLNGVERISRYFTAETANSVTKLDHNVSATKKIILVIGDKGEFALKQGFNVVNQQGKVIDSNYYLNPQRLKKLSNYNLINE